uniref:Reverse transcriptase domain-containing protein n=1 Tax=Tanacetum cinerariifolium TaxID=118510 RepID=A0A6L2MR99_TANCI|nr:reverse transcriptase domain-containing protein [Tanacetum cinerariifolium]
MAGQAPPQGRITNLCSMEELLQAPIDGVRDAIVVPPILANQFEFKIGLLNLDSLNSAANGNCLTKNTQEALTIIENKSKVQASRNKTQVGVLPSDTVPNPRGEIKSITTRSGIFLDGPSVPPPPPFSYSKEVERDPKTIMDQVPSESTIRVPPSVVQSPPTPSSEHHKRNPQQPPIPYPSRLNKDKLQDKSDIQIHKFLQMFKKLHFNISLAKALALMQKYHKMLKDLLSDKEKLLILTNTSLTENCSAVLLKKLLEKLRDPERFLIPCDFHGLKSCMALADLGASINLMPLSVWKKLSLPDLNPTRKTLELATRSIAYPAGRHFLRTDRALVDVHGEELILRDDDEKLIFHADSTSKHPHKHGNDLINMINLIDITYEDCFPEVLIFKKSNHPSSGSTTPLSDSLPSLTPFETSDSLLEEFADELALLDPFPSGNKDGNFDPKADLREIKYLLNQDPSTESDIEIIDHILERFTDEPDLDYSPPPGDDDDDDDDLFDLKSDNDKWKKLLYGDFYKDIDSEKDKKKDFRMKIIN